MKVLHLYNSHRRGGGSDNTWGATIRQSRAAGIEVEVLSRHSTDIAPTPGGRLGAALSGLYSAGAVAATREAIARFRPDVVHTHELYPLLSPWVVRAADRMGVPVVHSCYDYRLSCPIATHFRAGALCHRCTGGHEYHAVFANCRDSLSESLAYAARGAVARQFGLFTSHVAEFLVFSPFQRQWLVRDVGISADRVTVAPCVIQTPPTAADPAEGGYIGFAGRFAPEKGVELLIEAARRTSLPVRLAGDAPSHPALRSGDNVQCVTTNSRAELDAFYHGARMLVVPSLWHETFCIVAAEAMGHGIPVLAARLGALQDLVIEDETGMFFDSADIGDLARQMLRLWHDPALCRRLGAAGRRRTACAFNAEVHLAQLTAAYQRAMARGPRRGA